MSTTKYVKRLNKRRNYKRRATIKEKGVASMSQLDGPDQTRLGLLSVFDLRLSERRANLVLLFSAYMNRLQYLYIRQCAQKAPMVTMRV